MIEFPIVDSHVHVWDSARLSMVLAVLEAHCGVRLAQHDVYLNVAGGYRISEPAADLAVASALVSSLAGLALPADCVYFGEISLSGAVRPVAHTAQRLKEAEKPEQLLTELNTRKGSIIIFMKTKYIWMN